MASLNENFKIKNGLTVNETISAGSCVEADSFVKHDGTSSQFLKADGSVDSTSYTTCLGTVTSLSAGDGLLDNGTSTDPNIAVDSTVVRTSGDQTIAGVKSFSDDITVGGNIYHDGDTNTRIAFATDSIIFNAGGNTFLCLDENGQDHVVINPAANDIDLRVKGTNGDDTLFVSATAENVGIGTDTPGEKLDVIGNVQVTDGEFIGDLRGAVEFHALAGEDLAAGDAVYISGISGTTTVVSKADADVVGEYPAFGINRIAATSGQPAHIVQFGDLAGLDTTGWGAEGTELYVSTTAGQLISSAPTGETASIQKIAKVTRYHASAGSITIMGAGRSNAVPNLNNGNIFIGNGSNQPTTASLATCVCATGDARYIQGVSLGPYLTGGGSTGTVTVGIDSACASKWDTAAAGDISEICLTAGLSGSSLTNGIACIGLDSATAASLDQSALESCAGLDCTGTTTASNTQTFTNKSGNISQWTNDSGYTTCEGTVCSVNGTGYLLSGGTADNPTLNIQATCGYNWDNTFTTVNSNSGNWDQSGCAGLDCVGDITGVTAGGYLTGGSTSGDATIGLDSACAVKWDNASAGSVSNVTASAPLASTGGTTPDISLDSACETSWDGAYTTAKALSTCPGLDCTGTTTASNTQTFTNKSGSNSQWTNDAGYTTCTGTTTPSNTQTFTNKSGNISQWTNDSGYTTCTGDIEGITLTAGLTGASLTSGTASIGIDGASAANWDQSSCPGINCTGTTTASNTQTFTNKSGNISQWTNDSGYTTCNGDITSVTASGGLSGGASSGDATLGIDAATAANFDQSACPGINCTGTTTASNTQTFTNKSGNISQWTNDSGYTTCNGTFNTAGGGLSASGSTVAVDGALVTTLNQSSCPGINCTGTTTASNTQTFTNKSGSNSQWTNDAGYTTCTGTVTTAGAGLSGTSTTIGLDAATAANFDQSNCVGINCQGVVETIGAGTSITIGGTTANATVGITTACNTEFKGAYTTAKTLSGCPGLACIGTTTASNSQTFTNKSGNISQWTNDSGYTTCTGTVCSVNGVGYLLSGGTADNPTLNIIGACGYNWDNTYSQVAGLSGNWDQSACPGLLCTGTTTASNTQTFTNKSGNISQWTNDSGYTTCNGTVTSVTGGDGIDSTGGATPSIAVDATVVRTSGDQSIAGCKTFSDNMTITGNLSVTGEFTSIDTCVAFTSAVEVTNHGTGPALCVNQTGNNDIMNILDDGSSVMYIEDGGNVGIACTDPTQKLDVNGNVKATCFIRTGGTSSQFLKADGTVDSSTYTTCLGDITGVTAGAGLSGGGASGSVTVDLDGAMVTLLNQSSCPGINCTGTTTASNTQTFTNKSGSNSQWTNDAGYTTCTGTFNTAGGGLSASGSTVAVDGSLVTTLNQSACPGINCVGIYTDISAGTGITKFFTVPSEPTFSIDSSCRTAWNGTYTTVQSNSASWDQSTCPGIDCTGTVTSVDAGDGTVCGGTASAPTIGVDGTVIRTTGDQCMNGIKHFTGSNTRFTSISATGLIQGACVVGAGFMEANAPADQVYSQGTVLAINLGGCVVESTQANDTMVFGVAAGDNVSPVVMGAEPICITGEICVGDYIVTSDKVGHGMKADNPTFGTVIGQAMESGCGDTFAIKAMIRKM